MTDTKKHPLWKEVADIIVENVRDNGRGIFYSLSEFKTMLDIKEPETIEEYKKTEFEFLDAMVHLRDELLSEHNIYLSNKRGEGYMVMQPDDQVKDGPEKDLARARAGILKAQKILTNIEESLLSAEMQRLRLEKMTKVAFLRGGFRRKKFPAPPDRKQLQ